MGSGKSTIGRLLARRLRLRFVDLDKEIEKISGRSVRNIFESEGEDGFRRLEAQILDHYTHASGTVVSTGGGIVMTQQNRMNMRNGVVVYLHATPSQQFSRVRQSSYRPLLNSGKPLQKLTELMEIREPLYRSEADIVVHTDGKTEKFVVEQVEQALFSQ